MVEPRVTRPVVLCVLDGLGTREQTEGNAVAHAATPALDALAQGGSRTLLQASGVAVGLGEGQLSGGAQAHLVIGAGRAVAGADAGVTSAIAERKLATNEIVDRTIRICLYDDSRLHLFGLLSDAGVHGQFDHLLELIDIAAFNDIPVVVHGITDGCDTPRRSAMDYIDKLLAHCEGKCATIGTLSGRHYAMGRAGRWDLVYRAFHAIVRDNVLGPEAARADTPFDALSRSYGRGLDDEQLLPIRIGDYQGLQGDFVCDFSAAKPLWEWNGEDCGFATACAGGRLRELCAMLTCQGLPAAVATDLLMDRDKPVRAFREHCFATLVSYGEDLGLPAAFSSPPLSGTLGEALAGAGLRQLRCSESHNERQAGHDFSGRRSQPFEGEERCVVPSPMLVDRYHEQPQLAAPQLAACAAEAVAGGEHDFVLLSLPGPGAVAHSGQLAATVAAVEAVDRAVGVIAQAVAQAGGALLVTATHGNAETMTDAQGRAHGGHTAVPVPLYLSAGGGRNRSLLASGTLADVAPTALALLRVSPPPEMTGRSLLVAR